jgi:hypothetical protein
MVDNTEIFCQTVHHANYDDPLPVQEMTIGQPFTLPSTLCLPST